MKASFEIGSCINTGSGVPLDKNHVAQVVRGAGAPEMIEANIVQGRCRSKTGDMPAEFTGNSIGSYHHRHRIPANQRPDSPFQPMVSRTRLLHMGWNGIQISGIRLIGDMNPRSPCMINQGFDQKMRTFMTTRLNSRGQGIKPFVCLCGIDI